MDTGQKILAAIGIILILLIAYYAGGLAWLGISPPTEPEPTNGEPPTGWLGGTFDLTIAGRNSLDSSASLVVGTDFTGDFYAYRSGSYVFLGAGSATGTQIESEPSDNGYIWLLTEEINTKYYYADIPSTLSKSTYISEKRWTDADGDGDKEFVFKISLWNIPKPASGYPSRTFYPYFMAESGQGTAANALTINAPDNITVGTATTTKYIGWESALSAEKMAVGIYKVEIVINSTDSTKWILDKVNVPGAGYLDGSQFVEDVRSADTKYSYVIGNDFDNIIYWKVPSGTQNRFDNTVALRCTFGADEFYDVTLTIYQWTYDRVSVSDSDTVQLAS